MTDTEKDTEKIKNEVPKWTWWTLVAISFFIFITVNVITSPEKYNKKKSKASEAIEKQMEAEKNWYYCYGQDAISRPMSCMEAYNVKADEKGVYFDFRFSNNSKRRYGYFAGVSTDNGKSYQGNRKDWGSSNTFALKKISHHFLEGKTFLNGKTREIALVYAGAPPY